MANKHKVYKHNYSMDRQEAATLLDEADFRDWLYDNLMHQIMKDVKKDELMTLTSSEVMFKDEVTYSAELIVMKKSDYDIMMAVLKPLNDDIITINKRDGNDFNITNYRVGDVL